MQKRNLGFCIQAMQVCSPYLARAQLKLGRTVRYSVPSPHRRVHKNAEPQPMGTILLRTSKTST